jgi:hypothetical protein
VKDDGLHIHLVDVYSASAYIVQIALGGGIHIEPPKFSVQFDWAF